MKIFLCQFLTALLVDYSIPDPDHLVCRRLRTSEIMYNGDHLCFSLHMDSIDGIYNHFQVPIILPTVGST